MKKQKELIEDFIDQDKWLLIVLDACRYDYLIEIMDQVEPTESPALNTPQWINKTWPGSYEATYVSATPWILKRYDGYEHFENIENVWDYGWDNELGTVPPGNIVKVVKKVKKDKMIAHFMQPHMPYIGSVRIDSRDLGRGPQVKIVAKREGIETVKEAYKANLNLAVGNAYELIRWFDGPIAITADHGELLGEEIYGEARYGHNKPDCGTLRKVPWRMIL